jgi:hypothetical protein
VDFVPYVSGNLILAETGVTEQHWSMRQAAGHLGLLHR